MIQDHQLTTLIKCYTLLQVDYLQITTELNKLLIFTKILEHYTSPTQYVFLFMSPSTNTIYGSIEDITVSSEANTITTSPSHNATQTDSPIKISKIIKDLTAYFISRIKETN